MVEVFKLSTKETRPTRRFFCAQNLSCCSIVTLVPSCFKQIKSRIDLRAASHGARGKVIKLLLVFAESTANESKFWISRRQKSTCKISSHHASPATLVTEILIHSRLSGDRGKMRLERFLGCCSVDSYGLEEASAVLCSHALHGSADCRGERCGGAFGLASQRGFHFRPHVLDGVEIRGIGWQVEKLGPGRLNRIGNSLRFVT